MFCLRAPLLLLLLFFYSFASAQSYWKSQWITPQANVKTLKIDKGRRWSVDIDLLKKANNGMLEIQVIDTGIGIRHEDIDKLF